MISEKAKEIKLGSLLRCTNNCLKFFAGNIGIVFKIEEGKYFVHWTKLVDDVKTTWYNDDFLKILLKRKKIEIIG
jgi:hypothetical protein